jgi:hypothetical protein
MVDNVGGHWPASKKRVVWKFVLGDSDTIHEVELMHSVLSTKKVSGVTQISQLLNGAQVVCFDGKEYYLEWTMFSGTSWRLVLIYENTNSSIEVRINEMEPKYGIMMSNTRSITWSFYYYDLELIIDRVPFRKMDVYHKKKKVATAAPPMYGGGGRYHDFVPKETNEGNKIFYKYIYRFPFCCTKDME